jgi:hypothetical protein
LGNILDSPAADKWILSLYIIDIEGNPSIQNVAFNTTGEALTPGEATDSLDPLVTVLDSGVNEVANFNIWEFLNWVFVSQYWIALYDAGQIAPIYYNTTIDAQFIFSEVNPLPPTHNIFVNNALFQKYSSYLREVIVPMFSDYLPSPLRSAQQFPEFLPLDESNRLQPVTTTIFRTYSCSERRMKGWATVLVAVFAADYTILAGTYGLFILVASRIQERRNTAIGNGSFESMVNELVRIDGDRRLINEDNSDVEGETAYALKRE